MLQQLTQYSRRDLKGVQSEAMYTRFGAWEGHYFEQVLTLLLIAFQFISQYVDHTQTFSSIPLGYIFLPV